MTAIIGYQDDVIGFGLAGVAKMVEMKLKATKEEVAAAVRELTGVKIIFINEALHDMIREMKFPDIFFIDIPENLEPNTDQIERLTREALGVVLK